MMHMPAESAVSAPSTPEEKALIAEPVEPGTSPIYLGGRPLRGYILWYTFASLTITAVWGAILGILLPNQVQILEFARFFTGANAHVDLTALENLRAAVAGGATATPAQQHLLAIFRQFDASRAQSLSLVTALGVLGRIFGRFPAISGPIPRQSCSRLVFKKSVRSRGGLLKMKPSRWG